MHTELRDKHDFSEAPPLPPAPHFDLASIAQAKPVQPLRRRRIPRYSRGVMRLTMAIFAGIIVMVLGIATMARLNKQINAAPPTSEAAQAADSVDDAAADVDTDSSPATLPNSSPLVVTERRKHRGRHHIRAPREMYEEGFIGPPMFGFEQPTVNARTRARLVTVIQ